MDDLGRLLALIADVSALEEADMASCDMVARAVIDFEAPARYHEELTTIYRDAQRKALDRAIYRDAQRKALDRAAGSGTIRPHEGEEDSSVVR